MSAVSGAQSGGFARFATRLNPLTPCFVTGKNFLRMRPGAGNDLPISQRFDCHPPLQKIFKFNATPCGVRVSFAPVMRAERPFCVQSGDLRQKCGNEKDAPVVVVPAPRLTAALVKRVQTELQLRLRYLPGLSSSRRSTTLMSAFPSSRRVNSWLPQKQPVQALPSKAGGTAVMTTLIIL